MDKAYVTADGIRYRDWNYSAAEAVRMKWFEQAYLQGEWAVQVQLDHSEDHIIHIICPLTSIPLTCRRVVKREADKEVRDSYFAMMRKLKEQRAALKSKRRHVNYINN